jgi:hypothetical protein
MTTSREYMFIEALDAAVSKGIKIQPGPTFDWTNRPSGVTFTEFKVPVSSGKYPSACNAIGALELLLGRERKLQDGFTEKTCEHLKVGTYWLYRFHIGFDQGMQLTIKIKDKNGTLLDRPDPISRLGLKLRKRYVKNFLHSMMSAQLTETNERGNKS